MIWLVYVLFSVVAGLAIARWLRNEPPVPAPAASTRQDHGPLSRGLPADQARNVLGIEARPGCVCVLCSGLRAMPGLRVSGRNVAQLTAGMVMVANGHAAMAISGEIEDVSAAGVTSLRLLVVSRQLFESVIEPAVRASVKQEPQT